MQTNVIYIGIDVDDNSYHGCAFNHNTGEIIDFKTRPTLKPLVEKIKAFQNAYPDSQLKACYEASYIGFSLMRDLIANGIPCDVVAPNLIPKVAGNQVKTDRIDAGKLAEYYAKNLLTIVTPPEAEQERDRDLLRTRYFLVKQQGELRSHIHSLLRRHGHNFLQETGFKSYWTQSHMAWIDRQIATLTGSLKRNLEILIQQLKWLTYSLSEYDQEVDSMAQAERYEKSIQALTCYKGIRNLFALTIITEIGNINRFPNPRNLVSWVGMDIREYSSGGRQNKFGITKHGNHYLRTAFIESNQKLFRGTNLGEYLISRRKKIPPHFIHIADRCLARLKKKGGRLLHAGKHPNKIKVACAREMIGFVWESLRLAQQV